MATLSAVQLAELRRSLAGQATVVNWNKAQVNAALQAIEDWFEANRAGIAGAINTATSPYVFTAAQKKPLLAHWLMQKYGREVV